MQQRREWEISQQISAPNTEVEDNYADAEMDTTLTPPLRLHDGKDEDELAEMMNYEDQALNALVAQASQENHRRENPGPEPSDPESDDEYRQIFNDMLTINCQRPGSSNTVVERQSAVSSMDFSPG